MTHRIDLWAWAGCATRGTPRRGCCPSSGSCLSPGAPQPPPGRPRGLRSPRDRVGARPRPGAARAALPLRSPTAPNAGPAQTSTRRACARRTPQGLARRHDASAPRAGRVPREAGGPDPTARGATAPLPRRACPACRLAITGRTLRSADGRGRRRAALRVAWPRRAPALPDLGRAHAARVRTGTCPRCGGRLRLIATIADPPVAERLVTHLARAPGSPTTPA